MTVMQRLLPVNGPFGSSGSHSIAPIHPLFPWTERLWKRAGLSVGDPALFVARQSSCDRF